MMSPFVRHEYARNADSRLHVSCAYALHVHSLGVRYLQKVRRLSLDLYELALWQLSSRQTYGISFIEVESLHHLLC